MMNVCSTYFKKVYLLTLSVVLVFAVSGWAHAQERAIEALELGSNSAESVDEVGYKITPSGESEFDNQSESFVKDWREADPDYEDTVFGDLIYNETSTSTKLELLRLLSKDTPSLMVFMHAISMGLDLGDMLQAAVKYDPSKGRDMAASAVNILPLMTETTNYLYSGYELDDLEREQESDPYSVSEVVEKFFESRLVLRPYPDWFDGQYHFLASAAELKELQTPQENFRWYRTKSTLEVDKRPIFVSLYEGTGSVLIDGEERITEALAANPDARLPVVFIFNRLNERSIDELGYPATLRGIQQAFAEKSLMITPTPEWQLGEYHIYAELDEIYDIFDLPEEEDYEPEAWDKLISEAEDYTVTNTSFLFVMLGSGEGNIDTTSLGDVNGELLAAWDDPRTEEAYPFVQPSNGDPVSIENIMGKGMIFNRPDLVAALRTLGVERVPASFYYIDSTRVKPFTKGPRALIQAAIGAGTPPGSFGGGGFETPPPASPPGLQ